MFEGMPSTICEAMLCECIPIGSNVNGIPNIIGDTGIVINNKDISETVNAIKLASKSQAFSGKKSRERIIKNFSLQSRKTKLLGELNKLLN
jgi:glycosyltransferase involved in cell wall biosynthesis